MEIQTIINEIETPLTLLQQSFLFRVELLLIILLFLATIVLIKCLKYNEVKQWFVRHDYAEKKEEPTKLTEYLELGFDAPLLSGNGICMWRVCTSLPLVVLMFVAIIGIQSEILGFLVAVMYMILFYTDALDGAVARALNNATRFGKILDPFADKVLDLPILLLLCSLYSKEFTIVAISIALLDIVGQSLRSKISNPAANLIGKAKTVFKVLTIYVLSLMRYGVIMENIGLFLLVISLFFTIGSCSFKVINKMKKK